MATSTGVGRSTARQGEEDPRAPLERDGTAVEPEGQFNVPAWPPREVTLGNSPLSASISSPVEWAPRPPPPALAHTQTRSPVRLGGRRAALPRAGHRPGPRDPSFLSRPHHAEEEPTPSLCRVLGAVLDGRLTDGQTQPLTSAGLVTTEASETQCLSCPARLCPSEETLSPDTHARSNSHAHVPTFQG